MGNGGLILTLAFAVAVALTITLALYSLISANPVLSRLPFGLLVSLVPAVGVIGVIKVTKLLLSWRGAVFIYTVFFVAFLLLQAVARLIPVHS